MSLGPKYTAWPPKDVNPCEAGRRQSVSRELLVVQAPGARPPSAPCSALLASLEATNTRPQQPVALTGPTAAAP